MGKELRDPSDVPPEAPGWGMRLRRGVAARPGRSLAWAGAAVIGVAALLVAVVARDGGRAADPEPSSAASGRAAVTSAASTPARPPRAPAGRPPAQQDRRQAVALTLGGDTRGTVGQTLSFRASARAEASEPYLTVASYDGRPDGTDPAFSCPTPQPGPRRPGSTSRSYTHVFDTPGRHTVTVRAHTGCSYYVGQATRELVVYIDPAPSGSSSP